MHFATIQSLRTKEIPALALPLLLLLGFNTYAGQAGGSKTNSAEDRVVIKPRRIVLRRSRALARQFPERKTAVVTYPVISGLRNPAVLRRLRALLEFKNIFDYSLDEYRDDAWLSEFSYVVNYNSNYLLDITFRQSGMAAYPDEHSKHFLINLKDGNVVKAADAFHANRLDELAALVDHKLQLELKEIADDNASSSGVSAEDKDFLRQAHEPLKFEVKDLDDFSVGRTGITFLYDAGLPHVIQAFEPAGRYFFNYSALSEYISSDGPLRRFKR